MEKLTLVKPERTITGDTATIYDVTENGVSPEQVYTTAPQIRDDDDMKIIASSGKYIVGDTVLDPITQEILAKTGDKITPELLDMLVNKNIDWINIEPLSTSSKDVSRAEDREYNDMLRNIVQELYHKYM